MEDYLNNPFKRKSSPLLIEDSPIKKSNKLTKDRKTRIKILSKDEPLILGFNDILPSSPPRFTDKPRIQPPLNQSTHQYQHMFYTSIIVCISMVWINLNRSVIIVYRFLVLS